MAGARDTEIIRDEARLFAVAQEWNGLWDRAANPSPFLHHDWVTMCWRRVALTHPRAPSVVVVREGGEAVLAAPLMPGSSLGIFRAPSGLCSLLPQYNEALMREGGDGKVAIAALLGALGRDPLAVRLRLDRVPSWSPLVAAIEGHIATRSTLHHGALIEFPDGYNAYFARFSRPTRSQHQRLTRLLGEHGTVALRHSDAESFNADFDWLLAHKRAWTPPQGRRLRRWVTSPGIETDLRMLAKRWVGSGRALLSVLTAGQQRVAAVLTLLGGRTEAVCYAITYDPQFGRYSPGRLLMLKLIEHLAAHGMHRLDLMSGDTEWKTRLATSLPPILKLRARLPRGQ